MVRKNDIVEFTRDFVYSTIMFDPKIIRQVVKLGRGSKGKIENTHKHGTKTFVTVDIIKPKELEIINITRAGKAVKTKKFERLLPDVEKKDLEKVVKKISA